MGNIINNRFNQNGVPLLRSHLAFFSLFDVLFKIKNSGVNVSALN